MPSRRFEPCVRAVFAVVLLSGLTPAALAELPQTYLALLQEADSRDLSDDRFLETADMVSVLVDGGRAEVHAAILAHLPGRAGVVADWPLPDPEPAAPAPAPQAPQPQHRDLGEAPVDLAEAPEGSGGWLAAPLRALRDDSWAGHIRAGIQLERGNSELTDLTFAVELDRELEDGWRIDSQFEYFIAEHDGRTTRDNWLAELRVERELDNGTGYYAGGSYDRDEIGLYSQSAFLTAGGIWHVLERQRMDWKLRAGAGQRFREAAATGVTTTDWVAEAGSSFSYDLSETSRFASETTAYAGGGSRIDQRFTLTNRLFGDWAVQTGLRIEHEFEDRPGFEPTDVRLDISLLYAFD